MEILCFIMIAVICSLAAISYNNRAAITKEIGGKERLRELFKMRRNTIITLLLGIAGGGILSWITYYYYDATIEYTIKLLVIVEFLIPIAYIDYKQKIIPNVLLIGMLCFYIGFLVYEVLGEGFSISALLLRALLGLFFGGGVMLISSIISKGGMGMGDVKLFAVLGMYLGWQDVFVVIFLSIVGVAIVGTVLILMKRMKLKSAIPIGPFVLGAMMVSILLGI